MPKPTAHSGNELAVIKRALVAYMIDETVGELHISPDAAGKVLLAPDDWDVEVSQDRNGIHVELIDNGKEAEISAFRPPVSEVPRNVDSDENPF